MRLESRTTRSRSSGSLWYLGHQNQSNFLELESTKYVFLIDRRSFSCKVDFLKWVPFKNHLYWTCCLREFLGCCCCCSVSRFFLWGGNFSAFQLHFLMIGFGVGIGAIFLNSKSWVNEESRATSVKVYGKIKRFQKTARHGFVSWCWWCWWCFFLFKVGLIHSPRFSRVSDVQLRCKMACCTLRKGVHIPHLNLWPQDTYEPNDPEAIQKSFARHLEYSLACTRFNFTMQDG